MDKLSSLIYEDSKAAYKNIGLGPIIGKTVLITGASGLLGTYLLATLKRLSEKGISKVRVIAVAHNNFLPFQKYFLDYSGAKIIKGDVTDQNFYRRLPVADYIIHAAGYASPGLFMQDPVKTLKIGTLGTFSLFNKLRPKGKFIFISSSEVYSGSKNVPHKETDIGTTNTDHPRSCYIEAKCCGEAICNAFRSREVDAKSARLSLFYGPGTKPGDKRVLNSFIEKALSGNISMLDQGHAKRTYCYITDTVEIVWKILIDGKEPIYNVGGQSKTTIRELAKKIGKNLNASVTFPKKNENKLAGAPEDVWLNMTKVEKEFGKNDYVSLEDGLARTINWQKELYRTMGQK